MHRSLSAAGTIRPRTPIDHRSSLHSKFKTYGPKKTARFETGAELGFWSFSQSVRDGRDYSPNVVDAVTGVLRFLRPSVPASILMRIMTCFFAVILKPPKDRPASYEAFFMQENRVKRSFLRGARVWVKCLIIREKKRLSHLMRRFI